MKLLILSCNTGEGHDSAARAIKAAAERMGHTALIENPIEFGSSRAKDIVAASYNNMIKTVPKVFGAVYNVGKAYSNTGLPSPVYFANTLYAKRLCSYIQESRFNAVICTHLFGMEAMTAAKKRGLCAVASYGVLTDYTIVPFFAETKLNGYFLPHRDIIPEGLKKGMDKSRLFASGIPVNEKFNMNIDKAAARDYLTLPKNRPIYLIMSGGVGCGDIKGIIDELLRKESGSFTACILTGRNQRLYRELADSYGSNISIKIIPFTDKVNLYMRAADVMISKPGGLTCTEAAVSEIPLVHMMTIPGCETANVKFFSSRGMSRYAKNETEAVRHAISLARSPELAEKMRLQQRSIPKDAAEQIIKRVEQHAR